MEQKQLKIFQNNKAQKISILFSVLVALLPVLASYASGVPGFSVADVALVLFVGLSLLAKDTVNAFKVNVNSLVLGLALLIMFAFLACLAGFPSSVSDVVIRTVRYSFYIVVLFTAGKKFLDVNTLTESVKLISLIGSIFIVFQAIMYNAFGVIVKGYLPFLKLYTQEYANMDYEGIYELFNLYRPTSFFLEPAHYARYCIIGIILYLFSKSTNKKTFLYAAICAAGIIISTSAQGYFLLGVMVVIFIFTKLKTLRPQTFKLVLLLFVLIMPFAVIALLQIPLISSTIERTLSGNFFDNTSATGARLGGFVSYFNLPIINKLIGTGFGNIPEKVWMSSAAYWLYGSGAFVFLIYVYFLVRSFFQLDGKGKCILFVIAFLFITDDSFYSYMIVLYFSLILFKPKRSVNEYSLYSN